PFLIQADAAHERFSPPEIALPAGMNTERLHDRRSLSSDLDRVFRSVDKSSLDQFRTQAFDLLRVPEVSRAFDLAMESDRVRDSYGTHLFGKGCLLARRLLEAGINLATVYWHYDGS